MGSTAFGYQLNNGAIVYCLLNIICNLDDIHDYIKNRSVPGNAETNRLVNTVDNYFSNDIFDTENTRWRILFMADGSTQCCFYNLSGKFIYR